MKQIGVKKELCIIISDFKKLNSVGCKFLFDADSTQETLISSTKLRWLTHKDNISEKYFTIEQKKALDRIKKAASKGTKTSELRIKVLLFDDPRNGNKSDNEHIRMLMSCGGAEVRYLHEKEENTLRIAIQGRKLFLSFSENQEQKVHTGFLYPTVGDNDPLLNYYKAEFFKDFNRARKLKLKNNRIIYADNWFLRFIKWLTTDRIIAIISALLAVISIVSSYLFFLVTTAS